MSSISTFLASRLRRRPLLGALCAACLALSPAAAFAQTPPGSPASPAPSAPPAASPPVTAPAPAAPSTAQQPQDESAVDAAQMVEVPARPVALIGGNASWDDGFKAITGALTKIQSEMSKAGLTASGHPFTVFVETDDAGFRYQAMVPLDKAPEGKSELTNDVKIGASPSGKAMKFQHRGAYDDIDATYEAITAYLDEKNIEAQNLFIEEYLTPPKSSDDQSLEVDIYVFIKG
ncbi:MAG: GyrI-like domain-containing protein [Methylobacteriaceae bacterium]|nr:GyrI-like domain-containing protein [Methylobacteriaceae bacterium]